MTTEACSFYSAGACSCPSNSPLRRTWSSPSLGTRPPPCDRVVAAAECQYRWATESMDPIRLHYSEALIRRAVNAFWWRVVGWRFLIAELVVAASLVSLVTSGDRSWLVGAVGAVLALGTLFLGALYLVHYRGSVGRFRRMRSPEATFAPNADGFRIASDTGLAEIPWAQVRELWRFPDFWLVFFSPAQFMTLPTVCWARRGGPVGRADEPRVRDTLGNFGRRGLERAKACARGSRRG